MKSQSQRFILFSIITLSALILMIFTSAYIILDMLWLISQEVAGSILKILLIRWLSIPLVAIICTFLSFILISSNSKTKRINKKFLIFRSIVIFFISLILEYQLKLSQAIINAVLAGFTGIIDPLTKTDISFFIFWLPLLKKLSIFAICYNGTLLLLGRSFSIKQSFHISDKILAILTILSAGILILILRFENIHSHINEYIGYMDIFGKLLPTAISVLLGVMFFIILIIRQQHIKTVFITGIILTSLILSVLFVWPVYLYKFVYTPNLSSLQEKFAGIHAESTRKAFGLNNISGDSSYIIPDNQISNILANNFWQDNTHFLQVIQRNQEILPIFNIRQTTPILLSNSNGIFSPYFISVRESIEKANDLWDVKHFRNIFGYGAVIGSANKFDADGYPDLILKDLEMNYSEQGTEINNPYILFSQDYNNFVFINTTMVLPNFKKENVPLEEQTFTNVRSIPVNWFTKILLTVVYKDSRFLFTDYFTKDTRFIFKRKPKDILQHILPYFHYSEPRLILHNGELLWELDAYSTSDHLLTSKTSETPWGNFNWIQSPLKIFVSVYSGEIFFDIMNPNNPYIKIVQKLYPKLLNKTINLDHEKYLYPIDLFNIQSQLLQTYHDTNAASFYSGLNQREIFLGSNQSYKDSINNRFLFDKNKIALQQTYIAKNKNIFAAQLSGYIDENKQQKLYLYESPTSLGIPGLAQAQAFLNQDPEFSKISTLWGQIGSKISTSDIIFYPMKDKGIYLGTVFLESDGASTPLAAQFFVIDKTSISLGNTLEKLSFNALRKLNTATTPLSQEEIIQSIILEAYQDYLKAENARLNGNTQEYQENVDKIGASLRQLHSSF